MSQNENIDLVSQDVAVLHRKEDNPVQYETDSFFDMHRVSWSEEHVLTSKFIW